ncbi:MAG: hypothetical protein Rhirs2KO_18480 [Rhizobiaceae bacterium]
MGGETPVPYAALDCYAARHGISGVEFDWFVFLFRQIDDEWLSIVSERRKRDEALKKAMEKKR